jgi:hypothetical protein
MLSPQVLAPRPSKVIRGAHRLASELVDVSDEGWALFVRSLEVQPIKTISSSGGLGSYDMRPRRLVELDRASNLRSVRAHGKRHTYDCDFKAPLTKERFLDDVMLQYRVFSQSMKRYHEELRSGALKQPDGVSLAGALAILHVGGRGALRAWPELFDNTRARYEAAQGAF